MAGTTVTKSCNGNAVVVVVLVVFYLSPLGNWIPAGATT